VEVDVMIKKIAIAACFASALAMVSAPASAAAYLIGGKWYFFSLDFDATIKQVTGKDLKTGTFVGAEVKITDSQTLCLNPQSKFINPGKGPVVTAAGTSPDLTEALTKADRVKGTFETTAVVELASINPCKESNGSGWQPVYWQNLACVGKPESAGSTVVLTAGDKCYDRLAAHDQNGEFRLVTIVGTTAVFGVPVDKTNWTYLYLPTEFKYRASVENNVSGIYDTWYGACTFPLNPDNLQPYSLSNPPALGWAVAKVNYDVCTGITKDQYNTY
jgi:hypothetical protein